MHSYETINLTINLNLKVYLFDKYKLNSKDYSCIYYKCIFPWYNMNRFTINASPLQFLPDYSHHCFSRLNYGRSELQRFHDFRMAHQLYQEKCNGAILLICLQLQGHQWVVKRAQALDRYKPNILLLKSSIATLFCCYFMRWMEII